MDITYDEALAKTLLDALHEQRAKDCEAVNIDTAQLDDFSVVASMHPPCYRLVDSAGGMQEAGFKIQGALYAKELPPVILPSGLNPGRIMGLRQQVCVTGLGAEWYNEAHTTLTKIHDIFKASLPADTLYPLEFPYYEGHRALEAHTRYFSDRSTMPMARNQPFQPLVDPDGALRAIQPQNLLHATENEVDYVKRRIVEGKETFDIYDPALIKLGDLVEATFTCHCVPTRGGRYKMILGLRAVSLLREAPYVPEGNTALAITRTSTPMVRKRYYGTGGNAEVETARKRLMRLSIKP
ncbi:hypothetical protein BKA70DRAFT_1345571 [Coprinopsis sp. MPI-PUGE-AT-0042]|nr:hypothetical protein BKA70DRAFT_1345571 [Coprinopsis sp. MPI-PUGE-AT-0042]